MPDHDAVSVGRYCARRTDRNLDCPNTVKPGSTWILGSLSGSWNRSYITKWVLEKGGDRLREKRTVPPTPANAAYFLHCYVQNLWCFGHGRFVSNDFAEQSDSAKSISLNKVTQQSSFQNLAIFSVFATGFWSEKKIFEKNENVEKNQKQKMSERTKEKTKNQKWNEKNNDFLFN